MLEKDRPKPPREAQGPHWEHFAHGADIGVRGIGATIEEAFEQAALALAAVTADPRMVEARETVPIRCEAPDAELLLADWLNAIVYEAATRRMVFARFEAQVTEGCLEGIAWGETIDVARHQPGVEVKGATYTELRVRRDAAGRWIAQCVVDV